MLRRFFNSCFHKRTELSPSKSPQSGGSTETDSSDATCVSSKSSHTPNFPRAGSRVSSRQEAEAEAHTSSAASDHTMPKPKKDKAVRMPKGWKPYERSQKAARYYADTQDKDAAKANLGPLKAKLNQLFDELIPGTSKADGRLVAIDEINAEQCMEYFQRLGTNPETCELFIVLDVVQAETMGTIKRAGFVDGWARAVAESQGKVTPDWSGQRQYLQSRMAQVNSDPAYFKRLYDLAFQVSREPPQKAVNMGVAVACWEALYEPATHPWRSATVDWLGAWTAYLKDKFSVSKAGPEGNVEVEWKRTVSKDLWSQTRLFAAKTMEDETLSFWSEDQAWPGLIDEFVVWCREKGIVAMKNGENCEMEE
ncbi:Cullin binding-domain-containing protein [Achaetomium macrosporum]|uniref:Defective in cullin neddylation protein n=1 Tax=Achaetomium macrosporum TaxID=79813 RepID=A0AAN7HBT9_9PEZI|nr:Cullin binding-domain-containing protein [Achaetomium macrosporum]